MAQGTLDIPQQQRIVFRKLLVELKGYLNIPELFPSFKTLVKPYLAPTELETEDFLEVCDALERHGHIAPKKLQVLMDAAKTLDVAACEKISNAEKEILRINQDTIPVIVYTRDVNPPHQEQELQQNVVKFTNLEFRNIIERTDDITRLERFTELNTQLEKFKHIMADFGIYFQLTRKRSLEFLFRYNSEAALNQLWALYKSGQLLNIIKTGIFTKSLLQLSHVTSLKLEVYISEEEYEYCLNNAGKQSDGFQKRVQDIKETRQLEDERRKIHSEKHEKDETKMNEENAPSLERENFEQWSELDMPGDSKSRPPTTMTSLDKIKSVQVEGPPGSTALIISVGRGQIWMTASRDKKLTLIDHTGNIIRYSDQICSDNSYIMSAVKYGNDILVIGYDEHKILRLRFDGSNPSVFFDAGTYITMGLSILPESHVVLSLKSKTDSIDHDAKVLIIASSGEVIKTIQEDEDGNLVFDRPHYLVTTPTGQIIVADNVTTPNKLICVNKRGDVLSKQDIYLDGKAVTFSGIAYKDKKLYATDRQSGKAFVMNEDGTGAKCLLDRKVVTLPCGVSFDDEGDLLVGCWGRTIHTFKFQQSG